MNINEIISLVLMIAGLITAVGGAIAVIKKWISDSKPSKHEEIIKEQSEQIRKLDERISVLEMSNRKQDKFTNAMCSSMLALLEHNINGNSIEKLKEAKEELQEFLIHRG
jgi:hypothetical protein